MNAMAERSSPVTCKTSSIPAPKLIAKLTEAVMIVETSARDPIAASAIAATVHHRDPMAEATIVPVPAINTKGFRRFPFADAKYLPSNIRTYPYPSSKYIFSTLSNELKLCCIPVWPTISAVAHLAG